MAVNRCEEYGTMRSVDFARYQSHAINWGHNESESNPPRQGPLDIKNFIGKPTKVRMKGNWAYLPLDPKQTKRNIEVPFDFSRVPHALCLGMNYGFDKCSVIYTCGISDCAAVVLLYYSPEGAAKSRIALAHLPGSLPNHIRWGHDDTDQMFFGMPPANARTNVIAVVGTNLDSEQSFKTIKRALNEHGIFDRNIVHYMSGNIGMDFGVSVDGKFGQIITNPETSRLLHGWGK